MKRFEMVRQILERGVGGDTILAHGNFWRTMTLEDLKTKAIFGVPLVSVGDGANSNIIHALRGEAPFGADLSPRPPGARFRRMPAGRPAIAATDIAFIATWIDAGCPDDDVAEPEAARTFAAEDAAADLDRYVQFFRVFDDFFMFNAGAHPDTQAAMGRFMPMAWTWPAWDVTLKVEDWRQQLASPQAKGAVERLSEDQLRIVQSFLGDPIPQGDLNQAFWHFGCGTLPLDDLRPRNRHQMDGHMMWLVWLAFADAAMRLNVARSTWESLARAVALGMVGDSLFRTDRPETARLRITRYLASDDPKGNAERDLSQLSGDALLAHLIELGREAWGVAPAVAV